MNLKTRAGLPDGYFEGSILHRDNLGYEQEIQPGDIHWMTAGKGIVHSERETEKVRNSNHTLHGLQLWVALPDDKQEIDATFHHHSKENAGSVPLIV